MPAKGYRKQLVGDVDDPDGFTVWVHRHLDYLRVRGYVSNNPVRLNDPGGTNGKPGLWDQAVEFATKLLDEEVESARETIDAQYAPESVAATLVSPLLATGLGIAKTALSDPAALLPGAANAREGVDRAEQAVEAAREGKIVEAVGRGIQAKNRAEQAVGDVAAVAVPAANAAKGVRAAAASKGGLTAALASKFPRVAGLLNRLGGKRGGAAAAGAATETTLATAADALTLDEQAALAAKHVAGLGEEQAKFILEAARTGENPTSVTLGGSRVRGDFRPGSDVDIGFNGLTMNQATKLIRKIRKHAESHGGLMPEKFQIVPGREVTGHPPISTAQEFFQRSGVRTAGPRAGEKFGPSGSITFETDGSVTLVGQ